MFKNIKIACPEAKRFDFTFYCETQGGKKNRWDNKKPEGCHVTNG
jgi:hypothetical protein